MTDPFGAAGPRVLSFGELDSTNAEARRRAEAGETGPLWITAQRQTAGRGRRGHSWETGPGNLAATLLTTTDKPPAQAAQIALVAALAVADLICPFVREGLMSLKWPNDALVANRKVSGVMIESGLRGDRLWLAIGVGVNLATSPVAVERPATSLAEHLRPEQADPPTPSEALGLLAAAFERRLGAWRQFGFAPVVQAWTKLAHGLGCACTVRLDRETLHGVAEGLAPDGALRLRIADGSLRLVSAGDVFFEDGHAAGG